jgi:hypothetical protein
MIPSTAAIPPDGLSNLAALLAPVVIVAISAVAMALAGLLLGLVTEFRDLAARRSTVDATCMAGRGAEPSVRDAA